MTKKTDALAYQGRNDDSRDISDLFAIPDFRISSELLDDALGPSSLFFAPDLDGFLNPTESRPSLVRFPGVPPGEGFFSLKGLDKVNPAPPRPVWEGPPENQEDVPEPVFLPPSGPAEEDPWIQGAAAAAAEHPSSRHLSWVLSTATGSEPVPLVITEAGSSAYDTLLSRSGIHAFSADTVVDTGAYVAALLALVTGRGSLFFVRLGERPALRPTFRGVRISGYSAQVIQGLRDTCLRCGKLYLGLREHVRSALATESSPCATALASVLDDVLLVVQETVAPGDESSRHVLRLRATAHKILHLLTTFNDLVSRLPPGSSDEDILEVVFHQAGSANYSDGHHRRMMQEVLRRVSRPWLDFVGEWVGTKQEIGRVLSLQHPGQQKHFVRVDSESVPDDSHGDRETTDFRLDMSRMPEFIPPDVARELFETGRNLRFIRTHHPDHALAVTAPAGLGPPDFQWLYDWESALELEKHLAVYQRALLDTARFGSRSRPVERGQESTGAPGSPTPATSLWHPFGAGRAQIEARFAEAARDFDLPVLANRGQNTLRAAVGEHLSGDDGLSAAPKGADLAPHWSVLPVLSFGPIIAAQGRVVNRESLRLLLDSHDLRGHLAALRGFCLFGNGMFCSRLSEALFDPDRESAERRPGVSLPGGSAMGLRLGGRDTWPPASSELRLALAGVLSDSYEAVRDRSVPWPPGQTHLPGDLSFAIRDLGPGEIEKGLDPDSLEALDFLRLSYAARGPLEAVITPAILSRYDLIFKHLLRLLRLSYITNRLSRDVFCLRPASGSGSRNAAIRFGTEASHFVNGILSFFTDTGISIPWKEFESGLDRVQREVRDPDTQDPCSIDGPDRIRDGHYRVLGSMLGMLFLRKQQRPVLGLLEDILGIILLFAKEVRRGAPDRPSHAGQDARLADLYGQFGSKVHLFLAVCKKLSEEGRESEGPGGLGKQDHGNEAIGQLVDRLDFSGYYSPSA